MNGLVVARHQAFVLGNYPILLRCCCINKGVSVCHSFVVVDLMCLWLYISPELGLGLGLRSCYT